MSKFLLMFGAGRGGVLSFHAELARALTQEKRNKRHTSWRRRNKTVFFGGGYDYLHRKSQRLY